MKDNSKISLTFNLFKRGDEEIQLSEKYKNVVLVLGNTGAGKSTFTQWIAGDNDKLISKEIAEFTGEFIIEDHNRISTTTTESKTIFPELVIDKKTDTAYYDCPGFSDTRSTANDLAATYFIKKVADHVKGVKLIFIVNYSSVRKGVDRIDFMLMIQHAIDLIKNIDKFHNSIAIVATKVDNITFKRGKNHFLVTDDQIIGIIAGFLQEVKHNLQKKIKLPNISVKEKNSYENALKLINILLYKENENYTKIGIFRRPDEPGPLSNITLLQEGKKHVEKILHENLHFTVKHDNDFGYTISEKSKNDIDDLVEEINKNIWSDVSYITEKVQKYYSDLVDCLLNKMKSFVTSNVVVDVNHLEAQSFLSQFNNGYRNMTISVKELKNTKNPKKLTREINNNIVNLNLDDNIFENNLLNIDEQAKYFDFLQIVSDKELRVKPWVELFNNILVYFSESKRKIQYISEDIAIKINHHLNNAKNTICEHYDKKMKLLEIQKIPSELKIGHDAIMKLEKEIKNRETVNELFEAIQIIYDYANRLGIRIKKKNIIILINQEKYYKFLQFISDKTLSSRILTWVHPFKDAAEYITELEKWYKFLNSLYSKFSEYEIQRDRSKYDVANIADWGKPDKLRGIVITKDNFQPFLNKIENYNIMEYNNIINILPTELQLKELNHVLELTLKYRIHLSCIEPDVVIKSNYFMVENLLSILRQVHHNDCKNFLTNEKFKFINIFVSHTVFIDEDFSFEDRDLRLAVTIIAPKWEIIGKREINLNGSNGKSHSESKAKDGIYPGGNGVDGSPGNHGKPGGTFFGIGEKFFNGENLRIIANGGNGSSGQAGGNGASGKNGETPIIPMATDIYCSETYCDSHQINGFDCTNRKYETFKIIFIHWDEECYFDIYGKLGTDGGNGGNGGHGGNGGYPGDITLFELNGNSGISKNHTKGENGMDGSAGLGGVSGKHGDTLLIKYQKYRKMLDWYEEVIFRLYKKNVIPKLSPGNNGTSGANIEGMENVRAANIIPKLLKAKFINEYKNFARENLSDNFKKYSLNQFLNELDNNDSVKDTYNTLRLLDELQDLEEQFHNLSANVNFLPFYQSLLNRVSEYSQHLNTLNNPIEQKKVLNYLYTTILSKIHNLKENLESNLIINLTEYLNSIKEDISKLKNSLSIKNKIDIVNKYKNLYKDEIDIKIKEAQNFIENDIVSEINNIMTEIDNEIDSLVTEVIALQKEVKKDQKYLIEKRKKLKAALESQQMFSFLKIVTEVVNIFGPFGTLIGSIIDKGSLIVDTLNLNNNKHNENKILESPKNIPDLDSLINRISIGSKKIISLFELLKEISQEIKKFPEKLNTVSDKINNIQEKVNKLNRSKFDSEEVEALQEELVQELKSADDQLMIQESSVQINQSIGEEHNMIKKFSQKAMQLKNIGIEIYNKYKNDEEKIDEITKAIEEDENKFQILKEYERKIVEILSPLLQSVKSNLNDIKSDSGAKTKIALEITKLKVQSTLKYAALQIQQLTQGFAVSEDLVRCMKKLEEAMINLINIYNHIQNYQEHQEFANYIADISSAAANDVNITDQDLKDALDYLDKLISSNIVLQRYLTAIDAFKQFVFPVAHDYFKQLKLPSELELLNTRNTTNFEDIVSETVKQIDHMNSKLRDYKLSITKHDGKFGSGEFNSNRDSTQPFFVWKNEYYKNIISRLLSGHEVVLKADIEASFIEQSAIKFNAIELNFKTKNETKQIKINDILKAFKINIIHLGNSYYKYNRKTYLITTNSQNIWYHFEKNEKNEPVHVNDVYWKIKNGDFMLSPYTLWKIKLEKLENKKNYTFVDLEDFKNEIDLELGGYGHYINKEVIKEDLMVEQYYEAIDTFDFSELDVDNELNTVSSSQYYNSIRNKRATNQRLLIIPDEKKKDAVLNTENYVQSARSASSHISSPINVICNWLKQSSVILASNLLSFTMIMPSVSSIKEPTVIADEIVNDDDEIYYDAQEFLNEEKLQKESVVGKITTADEYHDALETLPEVRKLKKTKMEKIFAKYTTRELQTIINMDKLIFINGNVSDNSRNRNITQYLTNDENNIIQSTRNFEICGSLMLADVLIRSITGEKYAQTKFLSPMQKRVLEIHDIKQKVYEGLQEMTTLFGNHNNENYNSEDNEPLFYA